MYSSPASDNTPAERTKNHDIRPCMTYPLSSVHFNPAHLLRTGKHMDSFLNQLYASVLILVMALLAGMVVVTPAHVEDTST